MELLNRSPHVIDLSPCNFPRPPNRSVKEIIQVGESRPMIEKLIQQYYNINMCCLRKYTLILNTIYADVVLNFIMMHNSYDLTLYGGGHGLTQVS